MKKDLKEEYLSFKEKYLTILKNYNSSNEIKNFIESTVEKIEQGVIIEKMPDLFYQKNYYLDSVNMDINVIFAYGVFKTFLNAHGMYNLVDNYWTKNLAENLKGKKVLEVLSGNGWLAKSLLDKSVYIKPTDNGEFLYYSNPVVDIEKIDAVEAIKKYKKDYDVLILSWPPYDSDIGSKIVQEWGSKKDIIYIGEINGCCADSQFFNMLSNIEESPDIVDMPSFLDIRDEIKLTKLKPKFDLNLSLNSKKRHKLRLK